MDDQRKPNRVARDDTRRLQVSAAIFYRTKCMPDRKRVNAIPVNRQELILAVQALHRARVRFLDERRRLKKAGMRLDARAARRDRELGKAEQRAMKWKDMLLYGTQMIELYEEVLKAMHINPDKAGPALLKNRTIMNWRYRPSRSVIEKAGEIGRIVKTDTGLSDRSRENIEHTLKTLRQPLTAGQFLPSVLADREVLLEANTRPDLQPPDDMIDDVELEMRRANARYLAAKERLARKEARRETCRGELRTAFKKYREMLDSLGSAEAFPPNQARELYDCTTDYVAEVLHAAHGTRTVAHRVLCGRTV